MSHKIGIPGPAPMASGARRATADSARQRTQGFSWSLLMPGIPSSVSVDKYLTPLRTTAALARERARKKEASLCPASRDVPIENVGSPCRTRTLPL
jgi:hypothetical protein